MEIIFFMIYQMIWDLNFIRFLRYIFKVQKKLEGWKESDASKFTGCLKIIKAG